VQQVVILLQEKGITYERINIDLDNKPNWLRSYSPTEKVPLLIINQYKVLFESQVICDYLDEVFEGSLQPECYYEKARQRAWIEQARNMLNLIAKMIYFDKNTTSFMDSIEKLLMLLNLIETEHSGECYFSGNRFHLIDIIYATLFRYFAVIELSQIAPILQHMPHLRAWQHSLSKRVSIKKAVPINYNQQLKKFISQKNSYLGALFLKGPL
jgi:glutathione S-transferase